jgi:predicted aspartyl protease
MGTLIKLSEVSVGPSKAENVDAAVLKADLLRTVPVSLFLGRSFLRNFKLEVDEGAGAFSLSL